MGTNSILIPSPISNLITHALFFSQFFFFHFPVPLNLISQRKGDISLPNCSCLKLILSALILWKYDKSEHRKFNDLAMNSHNSYLQRDKTTNIGFVRRSPDISDFNDEHKDVEICSPPRTVLSNKSHDKVDFHVLFQYKPRSLSFTTNTFASTQFSLSIVLFFFFNPHPISYTRIDLRKNRVVVRDWFD